MEILPNTLAIRSVRKIIKRNLSPAMCEKVSHWTNRRAKKYDEIRADYTDSKKNENIANKIKVWPFKIRSIMSEVNTNIIHLGQVKIDVETKTIKVKTQEMIAQLKHVDFNLPEWCTKKHSFGICVAIQNIFEDTAIGHWALATE